MPKTIFLVSCGYATHRKSGADDSGEPGGESAAEHDRSPAAEIEGDESGHAEVAESEGASQDEGGSEGGEAEVGDEAAAFLANDDGDEEEDHQHIQDRLGEAAVNQQSEGL